MPGPHVFEYATIRLVPRVEREEFINIGVVVFCKRLRYLAARFQLDRERVRCFAPDTPLPLVERYLEAWSLVCRADPQGGVIATLDAANRFRWLTASRSTIVQSSPVHVGVSDDPERTLERLFGEMVV